MKQEFIDEQEEHRVFKEREKELNKDNKWLETLLKAEGPDPIPVDKSIEKVKALPKYLISPKQVRGTRGLKHGIL